MMQKNNIKDAKELLGKSDLSPFDDEIEMHFINFEPQITNTKKKKKK